MKKTIIVGIIIWVLAATSLIGIHLFLHKKPSLTEPIAAAQAIIRGMDDQARRSLKYYDSGLIRLVDSSFHIVGDCAESDEASLLTSNKASIRKIEFQITDQLLLERQTMVREAVRTLNNAEKKCLTEGFAAIIFRQGFYFLICDQKKYAEYVIKYGTECRTCEETRRQK